MRLSVIVPVYNESDNVVKIIDQIISKSERNSEIIIVDGGSTDGSIESVKITKNIRVVNSTKGRAVQMNKGAKAASGEVLLFLHADSILPPKFDVKIIDSVLNGHRCGCFQMRFDSKHPLLLLLSYMTKIPSKLCRGGDQGLFVQSQLFYEIAGFDESLLLFEDNEILDRLPFSQEFKIIPQWIVTSARKYREVGVIKLNLFYAKLHRMYRKGASQKELLRDYNRIVN